MYGIRFNSYFSSEKMTLYKFYNILFVGIIEHIGLFQHQVLPAEDPGWTPEALLLPHHEALEEDRHHQGILTINNH